MTIHQRPGLESVPAYRQGRAAGAGASKLSSNESPHPPLASVLDAVAERLTGMNRYPDMSAGELISALSAEHGVPADCITLGAGSVEVASQLIHAVAGPDDEVIFAWRSFEAYPSLVRIAGAVPVEVPLDAQAKHDLDAMRAAVTERTRLIFVCNPNNPTGTVVGARELEAFVASVPKDILVVIDEAYVHFDRSEVRTDGLTLFAEYENVAVLHTFSKAYGLAGLRIGYAISPAPVAANLRKTALPFGVTNLAQAAALASLNAGAELAARIDEVVGQRERLYHALREAGLKPVASQANFVWVPAADGAEKFAEHLESQGVIARAFPGEGVRISAGTAQDVDRVITAISQEREKVNA